MVLHKPLNYTKYYIQTILLLCSKLCIFYICLLIFILPIPDVISLEEPKPSENALQRYHPLFKSAYITEVKYDEVSDEMIHTRLHRITPIMFARPRSVTDDNETEEVCTDSLDEFPQIFTEEQLRNGFFVIAFPIGIYCFTLLAVICDSYFIPCVERICEALNLSQASNKPRSLSFITFLTFHIGYLTLKMSLFWRLADRYVTHLL